MLEKVEIKSINQTEKLFGLDLIRIAATIFVFLFHSIDYLQIDYGIFTPFISEGAIFMIAFFMLSGFVLFFNYHKKDFSDLKSISVFYFKRFISLMPLYWVIYFLYQIFFNRYSLTKNIILLPVELLGIQSIFSDRGLFEFVNNNGTWFISCLLLAYFIFPYLTILVKQMSKVQKLSLFLFCYLVDSFSPLVVYVLQIDDIYSNPFFRILEFLGGMLLCSFFLESNFLRGRKILTIICIICLFLGISILSVNIANYQFYTFLAFPCFAVLIYIAAGCKSGLVKDVAKHKISQYFSKISYAFFLAQFFVWEITIFITEKIMEFSNGSNGIDKNLFLILMSFGLCILFAMAMYEIIEKPCKKVFIKK